MKELYFNVAGHVFVLELNDQTDTARNLHQYKPFQVAPAEDVAFRLHITEEPMGPVSFQEELRQEDEGQEIVAGHLATEEPYFEFWLGDRRCSVLLTSNDHRQGTVYVEDNWRFGVNNAIMVMYALATANKRTALFHASVVSYQDRAYMFLGQSGTGKSTHSSLWLKYIEGTELVNDDNPVVRINDMNDIRVYGSPWSGKTPCYRNISYPLGGIVKLSQAPYNKMRRLEGLKAYAAVVPSISGKRWDPQIAEGLHETEELLARLAPIWHLDCLPDEAAARLSCKNCTNESESTAKQ